MGRLSGEVQGATPLKDVVDSQLYKSFRIKKRGADIPHLNKACRYIWKKQSTVQMGGEKHSRIVARNHGATRKDAV